MLFVGILQKTKHLLSLHYVGQQIMINNMELFPLLFWYEAVICAYSTTRALLMLGEDACQHFSSCQRVFTGDEIRALCNENVWSP